MSDYFEQALALVRAEMDADSGHPETPREICQDRVARLIRDAWLATSELVRLRSQDRDAAPFISAQESDLWTIKLRIDALIDEIRAENNEWPLPGPQGLRLVKGARR